MAAEVRAPPVGDVPIHFAVVAQTSDIALYFAQLKLSRKLEGEEEEKKTRERKEHFFSL